MVWRQPRKKGVDQAIAAGVGCLRPHPTNVLRGDPEPHLLAVRVEVGAEPECPVRLAAGVEWGQRPGTAGPVPARSLDGDSLALVGHVSASDAFAPTPGDPIFRDRRMSGGNRTVGSENSQTLRHCAAPSSGSAESPTRSPPATAKGPTAPPPRRRPPLLRGSGFPAAGSGGTEEHRARTGPPDAGAASVTGSDRGSVRESAIRLRPRPATCLRSKGGWFGGLTLCSKRVPGCSELHDRGPAASASAAMASQALDGRVAPTSTRAPVASDRRHPQHTRRRNLSGGRLFAQRSRSVSRHPSPAAASGAPASLTLGSSASRGMRSSPLAELHDQGRVPASAAACCRSPELDSCRPQAPRHRRRRIGLQPSSASDSTKRTRSGCREMECFR